MTTLTISVNVTNPDSEDRRAMMWRIGKENDRRASAGLALLPVSTSAERKSSYEATLAYELGLHHARYITNSVEAVSEDTQFKAMRADWADATPAQKAAAQAALTS